VGGLTGCLPDFVMLMVGANAGLVSVKGRDIAIMELFN